MEGVGFLASPPGSWRIASSFFELLTGQILYQPETPGRLDIAFVTPVRQVFLRFALSDPLRQASLVVEGFDGTEPVGSISQMPTSGEGFGVGEVTFAAATAFDRIRIAATGDMTFIAIDDLRADVMPRP